ncbi:MAG: thermonuclease family protein [Pseudomonadota bacterium]
MIRLIIRVLISLVAGIVRALGREMSRPRKGSKKAVQVRAVAKKKALNGADLANAFETLPEAKTVNVIDGDTVVVARGRERVKIRLDSIDCPEDGQPWGNIAKAGLIKLIGGRKVILEEYGIDPYGRTLATLYVQAPKGGEWQNVNERMVMLGHAWVMRMFYDHLPADRKQKLNNLENWAKSKRIGLWKTDNPVPPWNWRKGQA